MMINTLVLLYILVFSMTYIYLYAHCSPPWNLLDEERRATVFNRTPKQMFCAIRTALNICLLTADASEKEDLSGTLSGAEETFWIIENPLFFFLWFFPFLLLPAQLPTFVVMLPQSFLKLDWTA